jgi:hypothetical protein
MIKKLLLFVRSLLLNFSASSKERSFTPGLRLICLGMFFVINFAFSQNTWIGGNGTGAQRTSWNRNGNWSDGSIPTTSDNVVIPDVAFDPIISTATAVCTNLTIQVGGNLTVSEALTVSGTTSVSGALNIGATSGTKRFTGLVTINAGGSWNNSANSTVNFRGGITNNAAFTSGTGLQTFDSNAQSLSGNITINSVAVNSIVLTNNGVFTVSTALSGTGTLTNTSGATLSIGGTSSIANFNNAGTASIGGIGAISTTTANFINTGTLNLGGTGTITGITNNASGTVNLASSGIIGTFNNATASSVLQITAASPNITNLTATTAGNTVNYNGTAQTIKGTTYSNLILSTSGTKTLGGATTSTTELTLSNNTSLDMSTFLLTLNGNLTNNGTGTISGTSGGVTITGTNIQSIAGFTTAGTTSMTKTGGIATLVGNVNGGVLTISGPGGTLNLGNSSLAHTFTGNITLTNGTLNGGASTLNVNSTSTAAWGGTGTNFAAGTSTVNFGGGNQTVSSTATTFYNLNLSGTGTKSFSALTAVSNLWSIVTGVKADLGNFQHTAVVLTLGGAGPLTSTWGSTASSPVAVNTTNDYFIGQGRIHVSGAPYPAIDNNYASYSNGNSGQVNGSSGEYANPPTNSVAGSVTLTAPAGTIFNNVKFASYGSPGGTAPNYTIGTCHAFNSRTVTTGLLGNTTATIPASGSFNATFGDPCFGIVKSYNVVATYSEPFCTTSPVPSLVITGSTPTGGNGTYTYLWEVSLAGHSTGYSPAPGVNTGKDYTVSAGTTATTWYRRTVTSGIYSDATIVIVQVVTVAPTVPTGITASASICGGASTILTVSNGSLGGPGGYAEWSTGSCGGTVIGTGTSITVTPTANTTYYVRYRNACGNTSCLTTTLTNTTSITPASTATTVCFSSGAQTTSLAYTATLNAPTSYTIDWDTAANTAGLADQASTPFTAAAANAAGTINSVAIPANVPAGTYTGTITVNSGTCPSFAYPFTLTIRSTPTPTISGSTTVCVNASSPNVTFTNPQTLPIIVTYNINGGSPMTINVAASTTASIPAPTATSGTFVYNLVSAVYQSAPSCSNGLTGSATIIITPNVGTPSFTAGASSVRCQGLSSVTYTASTTNTTGITYTLDPVSTAAGNSIVAGTGEVSYVLGWIGTSTITASAAGCNGPITATHTVTTTPTIGTPSTPAGGAATICQGSAATAYTTSASDATSYNWTVSGTGNTISGTGTTGTVTWAPGFSGVATISVTANGCNGPSIAATRNITVVALPTTPTATVTVQPTCSVNTGTIVVTAPTGAGITYSIDGTNYYASGTFNNVAIGSHTVSVKNSSDCVATMASPLQVSPPVTKTWLGGQGTGTQLTDWSYGPNWSPAGIPTSADCVIIPTTPNNPIVSGTNLEFYANTLSVIANGSLVVQSGNTLKVTDAITVAPTGTLTFQDSSTLLQESTDNTINTGNIEYVRTTLPIRQADYVYWSTPVKGQTLAAVSPLTESDKYFRFDGTGWVATPKTTIMTVGKGYIIRGPEGTSNTVRAPYTATFRGTPNNGTITTETFSAGKYYLLGNPYPSAIDADKFISDLNNKGLLQGTLYFWTHNTPVTLGGYYRYNADDYASYNLSGGTKTMKAAKTANNAPGNINSEPQGYIAAGQSFMAGFSFGGQIQFTNSMRIGADKNAQFFKPGKTSKTTAVEKNRVWLNLTNEEGAFKQMLVGYIEGASNDYDRGYDGLSFDGNKYIDFYSIGGTRKLVIQGRALPFTDTDTVPLGYKTTIAGDFTISIDQADGIFTTQSIYLEDKTTGKIQDLQAANYTFTTAIGTFADRFVLRYTNKTLGTGDFENIENGLLVSVKDKTIKVTSAKENIKEVMIFDINGKLLYNKKKVGSTELQISNLQAANQVLLVKVALENEFTTTKKIIFQ